MDLMSLIAAGTGHMPVFGKTISAQGSSPLTNLQASNGMQAGSGSSFEDFLKSRVAEVQSRQTPETSPAYKENSSKAEAGKIIGELNIPEESKTELRKELESAETEEDVKNFLENLEAVLMQNGLGIEETLVKFTEAFVAENALKAVVPSAFDAAVISALKAKGYIDNDPARLNEQELKAVQEAFEKILTPLDAGIGKREMKIAEIIKPANPTGALAANTANTSGVPAEGEDTVNAAAKAARTGSEERNAQTDTVKQAAQAELPTEGNNTKTGAEASFRDAAAAAVKSGENALDAQEQPELEIAATRDIKKIADFIQYVKTGDEKKLTVQLMPKELGRLNIELVENAGKLTARITMESDQAKNLLVNNAESIRLQLEAKGIVLEKMEFLFAEKDPERGQDQFFKRKNTGSSEQGLAAGDMPEETADPAKGLYA